MPCTLNLGLYFCVETYNTAMLLPICNHSIYLTQDTRRKGLGGLTAEKKALLKKIIMEKVREEMRKAALEKKEEKERIINEKVKELPSLKGLTKGILEPWLWFTRSLLQGFTCTVL